MNSLGTNFHLWRFFFQTNLFICGVFFFKPTLPNNHPPPPPYPTVTVYPKVFLSIFFFFFVRVGKGELQDICENIAFVCKGIFK